MEHCSNHLPVFVSRKLIDGNDELCFCCTDLSSMEVIHLPCCKASVHRHCVLDALTTNDQCVYCRNYLSPQDILDCSPIRMALSGDASNTTRSQEEIAAPESIMSGGAAPGGALKAPPEATMSHEEVAANMNPHSFHEKRTSLSSVSLVGEEDNNGLLFAPTCTTCFNENKYLLCRPKKVFAPMD